MDMIKKYRQDGFKVRVSHFRPTVEGDIIRYSRKKKLDVDMKPTGGYTIIEVRHPDGTEVEASSKCSELDCFSYSVGANIALGRALKKLNQ